MKFFPATESTLSAEHLAYSLKETYGLNDKTKVKLIRTGMNHLYLVDDSKVKYVYRVYSYNWRSRVEIEEELRLLNHLKAHNLPISFPIQNQKGGYIEEFNAIEGKRFGVLFSYLEGKKNPYFSVESSNAIGKLMANIHQLTQDFSLDRVSYDKKKLFSTSLERTKLFFNNSSEQTSFLEKTSAYLNEVYDSVDKEAVRGGSLHLDIWFDNMHFDDDGQPSLFDFDFCGNGWLVHDVGYYLYQLFYTNPNKELYEEKAEAFLKGYESIRPLSKEEKRLVPYCGTAVLLFYISVQCDTFNTWSNVFLNEEHLKRYTGNMKRWMEYQGLMT